MNCFLVIGTPRSGSSCLAGVLHRLGVRMTLREFVSADVANPTGYYEDAGMNKVFDNVDIPKPKHFHALHDWYHWRESHLPKAILERCQSGNDWGFKSWKIPLLPLFLKHCPCQVKILRTQRNVEKSRASAQRVWGNSNFVDLIAKQISSIESHLFSLPSMTVSFDTILKFPVAVIDDISAFIGKPSNQAAVEFVQPSLRNIQ